MGRWSPERRPPKPASFFRLASLSHICTSTFILRQCNPAHMLGGTGRTRRINTLVRLELSKDLGTEYLFFSVLLPLWTLGFQGTCMWSFSNELVLQKRRSAGTCFSSPPSVLAQGHARTYTAHEPFCPSPPCTTPYLLPPSTCQTSTLWAPSSEVHRKDHTPLRIRGLHLCFLPLLESVKLVHDTSVATLPPSTSAPKKTVMVESCISI